MEVSNKIKENQPIGNGFEITKQFKVSLRIVNLKNIKQTIKKKWEQLLNLL